MLKLIEYGVQRIPRIPKGYRIISLYECNCGVQFLARNENVKSGNTKSCGCHKSKRIKETKTTHGHTVGKKPSRTMVSWMAMKSRCLNPKNNKYRIYGARGISICDTWKIKFENFLADMGERPEGKTLDRIDSNGNYEPGNCRWATTKEQASNRNYTSKYEKSKNKL